MFGKYFYNKNIRNIFILFGTVFNDITVKRVLAPTGLQTVGTTQSEFKVPISYGPAQKYLTKLEVPIDEDKESLAIKLPRLSFEITTMSYDPTRKLQTTKKIKEIKPLGSIDKIQIINGGSGYTSAPTVTISNPSGSGVTATATSTITDGVVTSITIVLAGTQYTTSPNVTISGGGGTKAKATANLDASLNTLVSAYTPVPYNFDIDLSVMVKNSDDGAQILEQILPYFTPEFHVTLNEMATLGIKRDIPIILNSISTEDDYEGDFLSRRSLTHTLSFTVQGYLYGPTSDIGIIREVDVNAGTSFKDVDIKEVNIDIKPDPIDADPDDNPSTITTITDV
jgi:hypothetical protein